MKIDEMFIRELIERYVAKEISTVAREIRGDYRENRSWFETAARHDREINNNLKWMDGYDKRLDKLERKCHREFELIWKKFDGLNNNQFKMLFETQENLARMIAELRADKEEEEDND